MPRIAKLIYQKLQTTNFRDYYKLVKIPQRMLDLARQKDLRGRSRPTSRASPTVGTVCSSLTLYQKNKVQNTENPVMNNLDF